ncbi:XdhC family protein [Dokdonella sp.]|uniref:XdhC family protein n=1 Tax=Dokdonella sp. TaxID=2291710 RepID=UPI002F41E7E6
MPIDIESPALPPLGGLRALVAGVEALAATRRDGVLCVVVGSNGSTYRKPGALVLLDAAGVRVGALSGGCLEAELEARARDVLANGSAQAVRFDTSGDEDRVFGSGTGCGGSIDVLLLPLPASVAPLRRALRAADARGAELVLDLVGSGERLGSGEARAGDERHRFDERGGADDHGDAVATDRRVRIAPAPRVLLLGAGPETRPLLVHARLLGWRVELADHRERWLRFAAGSGVDAEYRDGPDGLAALLEGARFDAALVMNHNLDLDARCLRALAGTAIRYIGLLGPAARRDELLAEIGDARDALLPRLRAPIGLRLGGEGAEAIALAIVAEMQQEFARAARPT